MPVDWLPAQTTACYVAIACQIDAALLLIAEMWRSVGMGNDIATRNQNLVTVAHVHSKRYHGGHLLTFHFLYSGGIVSSLSFSLSR